MAEASVNRRSFGAIAGGRSTDHLIPRWSGPLGRFFLTGRRFLLFGSGQRDGSFFPWIPDFIFSRLVMKHALSEQEFGILVSRHQAALYAYILTIMPDRFAAHDVLQESVLVMWRKLKEFEKGTNFPAWAYRIAYWQTMAHLKKVKRAGLVELEPEIMELLAREAESSLEGFEGRHQALRTCLQALAAGDASILQAHYQRGEAVAEIAGRLGRTRDAIKQVLMRIRKRLRQCIESKLADVPAS